MGADGNLVGPGDVVRHASQLYEAGLEGLLLLTILSIGIWKFRLLAKPGYITGLFLVGYGLARAVLETVRQPDAGLDNLPLGLTMGMMLSVPMIAVGAWLIHRAWKRAPGVSVR
jgi:phosphatidylglycerol:prolipoprotein diacylglycerol transferase